MSLYNMKTVGTSAGSKKQDVYRIVKFDNDLNIESEYELTFKKKWKCNCPAYERPTCRHRDMAPLFLKRRLVDKEWFYDYEKKEWRK